MTAHDERIEKWQAASRAARSMEFHFPADCLMEAMEVVKELQPRTIATIEELDALPSGSVVRSESGQVSIIYSGTLRGMPSVEVQHVGTEEIDNDYSCISLPVALLYTPGESS